MIDIHCVWDLQQCSLKPEAWKTSITSETISQQTICGDNEGLNTDVENNKEPQNNLSKAREIYFKYFSSQKMARTKATIIK